MSDYGIQIRHPRRFDIIGARLTIAAVGTAFEAAYGWRLRAGQQTLAEGWFQAGSMGVVGPIMHEEDLDLDYIGRATLQLFGDNPSDDPSALDKDSVDLIAIPGATGFIPYQVRPGDTLTSIAQEYGSTVERIAVASRLPDPDVIQAGQLLRVPD